MLRLFLDPRGSRFERLNLFLACSIRAGAARSIASIRYSVRSVLGVRAIEYLPALPEVPGRGPPSGRKRP
eukprot:6632576-Alexandrium_andersonii.AAC.1